MEGGREDLKVLWKIALLLVVLLALFYFMGSRVQENAPLESPVKHGTAIPAPEKEVVEMTAGPKGLRKDFPLLSVSLLISWSNRWGNPTELNRPHMVMSGGCTWMAFK